MAWAPVTRAVLLLMHSMAESRYGPCMPLLHCMGPARLLVCLPTATDLPVPRSPCVSSMQQPRFRGCHAPLMHAAAARGHAVYHDEAATDVGVHHVQAQRQLHLLLTRNLDEREGGLARALGAGLGLCHCCCPDAQTSTERPPERSSVPGSLPPQHGFRVHGDVAVRLQGQALGRPKSRSTPGGRPSVFSHKPGRPSFEASQRSDGQPDDAIDTHNAHRMACNGLLAWI